MNLKWVGPIALLAALVIGDQIRIHRPAHKYRLSVEVDTPGGVRSAAGVLAVQPDRSYSRGGLTRTKGDAVLVELGSGKNLLVLLTHLDKTVELDGMNYVALRAYIAGGRRVSFNEMSRMTGAAPVTGSVIPILASFADIGDPATMRVIPPDDLESAFGKGFALRSISAEVVPNGFWPLDFGGPLGEPVTRGIEMRLPWWNRADNPAAIAVRGAGLPMGAGFDARKSSQGNSKAGIHSEVNVDPTPAARHDRCIISLRCGSRETREGPDEKAGGRRDRQRVSR
jgi:hypothetical protein